MLLVQLLAEHCGVATRTVSGEWPPVPALSWRPCMRQCFTLTAPTTLAVELAVAGVAARGTARLSVVDNDTSKAWRPCLTASPALFQKHCGP